LLLAGLTGPGLKVEPRLAGRDGGGKGLPLVHCIPYTQAPMHNVTPLRDGGEGGTPRQLVARAGGLHARGHTSGAGRLVTGSRAPWARHRFVHTHGHRMVAPRDRPTARAPVPQEPCLD